MATLNRCLSSICYGNVLSILTKSKEKSISSLHAVSYYLRTWKLSMEQHGNNIVLNTVLCSAVKFGHSMIHKTIDMISLDVALVSADGTQFCYQ